VLYIVDSDKSFHEATVDLEAVVPRLGFVILQVHDLGAALRRKGIELDEDCKVFEICSFRQTGRLLSIAMRLNLALPWRISVFTENGVTRIGLIRPQPMLAALADSAGLSPLAREIDEKMMQIVDETR
jgi:uncharacterized protein (DUF302 family)